MARTSKYKILVLGKRNHLNWDVHVTEAFRGLGHDVTLVQYNVYPIWFKILQGLIFCLRGRTRMKEYSFRWGARRFKRSLEGIRPDLVFVTSAFFIPEAYYKCMQSFRPQMKIFAWEGDGCDAVEKYLPQIDHLFECGRAIQRQNPAYEHKVSTLCFAVNDQFYYNTQIVPRENKIYFCAACNTVRAAHLSVLLDFPVVLKGWGWKDFMGRSTKWEITNRTITNEKLRTDYNRYAIALNISQFAPDSYMLFNMRTFEAPCCGACLITQRSPLLDEYFEIGKEIVAYDTPTELREKIQWLMDHPELRSEIAKAGEARVKKDHTYQARMSRVIEQYVKLIGEDASVESTS